MLSSEHLTPGLGEAEGHWEQQTQVTSGAPVGVKSLVMRLKGKQRHFPCLGVCVRPQGGSMPAWGGPVPGHPTSLHTPAVVAPAQCMSRGLQRKQGWGILMIS